ncbi:MAG: Type 1 glutamine amidotransferase-like domain-containing protein [Gemmatimonadales bacterium]
MNALFRRPPLVLALLMAGACSGVRSAAPAASTATAKVGPPNGSVMVVGGGSMGPELYARFIELAGGPEALIVVVPTAGGAATYPAEVGSSRAFRNAGAKNVVVLHTIDRKLADTDSFVAPIRRAGAVWFDGGRQYRLVDSYGGTKSEKEFMNVLVRGGIVGGSSAGASILGSYMVRGAPSNDNFIISYPGYETGFGYLRGVGIDQHVVARMRLRDLADSLIPRHPELLGISEDEGTAWLVRGDEAEILGRNKAFVYGGKDPTDPGKPFLTLRPGDRYNLGARHVTHRAIEDSPLTSAFIDSLFAEFARAGAPGATVVVSQEGRVLVNTAYGLRDTSSKYMPLTTLPNFPLGALSEVLNVAAGRATDSVKRGDKGYGAALGRRMAALGMHHSVAGDDGAVSSSVDELYRWDQGLYLVANNRPDSSRTAAAPAAGSTAENGSAWRADTYRGLPRMLAFGTSDGRRHAFVRIPGHRVAIIILTNRADADVRAIADRITDRLLLPSGDPRWKAQQSGSTASCRSLSAVNADVAWAGCSGGRVFRTTNGGATWSADSVPGASRLDFRGIKAFDANTAVITSAGAAEQGAAKIYRTANGGRSWELVWNDSTKGIFLDGLAFWDAQHGFTFSDPVDGRLVILTTDDGGVHWAKVPAANIPPVLKGEAAFAASNTQLTVQGSSNAWIASGGGAVARVFRTTDRGRTWTVSSTGMPGGASAGLFGIAFADAMNGLAVGGDYRITSGITDYALRTSDGGITWRPAGDRRPDGVTQGVAFVPGSRPPVFVATGARGAAFTRDFGATWVDGDTLTSWAVGFVNPKVGWVAGPRGRVAKFSAATK